MTDEEIIKAMEICLSPGIPCDDCPLVEQPDCDEISRQYFYERFKCLKTENAALRERLEKAVELPCIEPMTTWGWDDKKGITKEHFDDYYQLIYRDKDGEFICTPGLKKEEAEAQLKELKGGEE